MGDQTTRFEVRLESTTDLRDNGKPHYRLTRLLARDADHAAQICRRQEFAVCAWEMDPDELAEAERIEAAPDEELRGTLKGRLFAHRQTKPYQVVSVTEIKGR